MRNTIPIDLFLGGSLGVWALEQILPYQVSQIFTTDEKIATLARQSGINVSLESVNKVEFPASPIGLSVHYPKVLKPEILSKYKKIYNLHPGYLPWGRGYYPVFWALWESSPAGATLHEMTAGLDEGPIVAQLQVVYSETDTGGSLHQRVQEAEKTLFREHWPKLMKAETISAFPQPANSGSYHSKKEFFALKQPTDMATMTGADLIRLIKCLTFPGYSGLEIVLEDRLYEAHLQPVDLLDT
jgi:methionyl-tRNA formyltransferase